MSAQGWTLSALGAVVLYLLSVPPLIRVAIHYHHTPRPSSVVTAYCAPYMWLMEKTPMQQPLASYYAWWFPELAIFEMLGGPGDWAQ